MAAPASARIEVLILPVADVDVAKSFYGRAGFTLDVDYRPAPDFRVVQVTPSRFVGEPRHKEPREGWAGGWADGPDPGRADYSTFADFIDPDGHRWVLQERGAPGSSPPK
jgi:catechol 2,3-dioxygenase-like lactoylglutathione lyase family enzyme